MMKQGGDSEVPKSPPYYRIIYSDEGVIPQRLPARRLTDVDNQLRTGLVYSTGTLNPTHSARFYTLMAMKTCFYGRIISFYVIFMYFAKLEFICRFFIFSTTYVSTTYILRFPL